LVNNSKKVNFFKGLKTIGLQKLLTLGALVVLYIFFSFFGRNFLSTTTLINIVASSYYIGFLAIGETFVIITGGIDLSVGTVLMCSALIGGVAYNVWQWPIAVSLVFVVVVATLLGLINGMTVAKLKIPPFIATLGMMFIAMGLGAIVSKVMTMRFPMITEPDGLFKFIFYKTQGGFPIGAVWLGVFIILASIILGRTRLGRYVYSIGSNEEATRLSGVGIDNYKIAVYTLSGFFTGLGAIVYVAAYTSVVPQGGLGIELMAIAGVIIGGTSLSGGIGSVTGTLIGVYIMSTLRQGLMSMNLQPHWQLFITGVIVIGAVAADRYRIKKASETIKE